MKKMLLLISLFLFQLLLIPPFILAGGGAFQTIPDSGTHVIGEDVGVAIKFLESDNITPRPNNNVEIRVENPKDGDTCYMTSPITNSEGMAYGKCTSSTVGSIIVYPYWIEGSQTGSGAIIYFVGPTPTTSLPPTSIPTKAQPIQPTEKPISTPTVIPTAETTTELSPTTITETPGAKTVSVKKENIFVRFWKFILKLIGLSS